jgi:transposase-like protein
LAPRRKYDPNWHPTLIRWMARSGLTVEQIGAEFGVTRKTVTLWAKQHPEVRRSLDEGRQFVDYQVEDGLLRRALGYEFDEVTAEQQTVDLLDESGKPLVDPDGTPRTRTTKSIRKVKRHVEPHPMACMYWLNNRQPKKWRREQKEQTGAVNPADLIVRMRPVVRPDATPPPVPPPPPDGDPA